MTLAEETQMAFQNARLMRLATICLIAALVAMN